MKVVFSGDIFLGGDLTDKPTEDIIQVPEFHDADVRLINLEHPIGEAQEVDKKKSTLYAGLHSLDQLKQLKIDAVGLANNHIQDLGIKGINNTIDLLAENEIGVFGAGNNIDQASKPYWINDKYAVLGYCDYGQDYLKQVQVADACTPGVVPLRYEQILKDLKCIKKGKQAILFFHWGREHVSLPPHKDIVLAKKLLKDGRIAAIVGMHAHRIQGTVTVKGKKAYMCLGNFLFPNFYMEPPVQICYPNKISNNIPVTRQYHKVFGLTYKKWKRVNRESILLQLQISDDRLNWKEIPVFQKDEDPKIYKLKGLCLMKFRLKQLTLSALYNLPMYRLLYALNARISVLIWNAGVLLFRIKAKGMLKTIRFVINKIK